MGKTFSEIFESGFVEELSLAEIIGMNIDMDKREVAAKIAPKKTVHKKDLYSAQKELCEKLGVKNVRLIPVYSPSMLTADYFDDIAFEANLRGVPINGFLSDSKVDFENGVFKVELAHGGAEMLLKNRCDTIMKNIVREEFGTEIEVEFSGTTEVTEISERKTASVSYSESKAGGSNSSSAPKPRAPKAPAPFGNGGFDTTGLPIDISNMEVVMGRPIKQRPMKLCDVDMQSGRVVIWGDIFSTESRETRDGESVIITIMLTDLTSSNILKIIAKKKEAEGVLALKSGDTVVVAGEA